MSKYSKFFAVLKEANNKGLDMEYKEVVKDFTNDRTDSLKGLEPWELEELVRQLMEFTGNSLQKAGRGNDTRDRMRKAVIAQFRSIGRSTQAAISWAEKYGVNGRKRLFNDYNEQELWQLIRNAEKVKQDFIKGVNKTAV